MRIIFVGGSAEPFRDGVGDYTRALACELKRTGVETAIIALNDGFVNTPVVEQQEYNGIKVQVLRLPSVDDIEKARAFAEVFKADVFSLQYVPYGFHPKGMAPALGRRLLTISQSAPWHVMFHELWVGLYGGKPTLKQGLLGLLQKITINRDINTLNPPLINTSIEVYKKALRRINVRILPLFGNIVIQYATFKQAGASTAETLKVVHFGTCTANTAGFLLQLKWLYTLAQNNGKKMVFYICGEGGPHKARLLAAAATAFANLEIIDKGKLPGRQISEMMSCADFGLSRADYVLYGKSGSAIAMLEHGLPLLLMGNRPAQHYSAGLGSRLYFVNDVVTAIPVKDQPFSLLPAIATLFMAQLEESGYTSKNIV